MTNSEIYQYFRCPSAQTRFKKVRRGHEDQNTCEHCQLLIAAHPFSSWTQSQSPGFLLTFPSDLLSWAYLLVKVWHVWTSGHGPMSMLKETSLILHNSLWMVFQACLRPGSWVTLPMSHSSIIPFGVAGYKLIIFPTSRFVSEPYYPFVSLSNRLP